MGLTLGGTMLRRLGYALVACSVGFAFIGTLKGDYFQTPFLAVAALSPVFLGVGIFLIIVGWTLAIEGRRSLKDRETRLEQLEQRAVTGRTRT
jgi:hypothetical protein